MIKIVSVDGYDTSFGANTHTLVITADDIKGSIAFMTNVLANDDCNIAFMTVARRQKKGAALWVLELDSGVSDLTLQYIKAIRWVRNVVYFK